MTLQYQVESVPEGMEQFYKESDSGFVLAVEGLPQPAAQDDSKQQLAEMKAKLDEFRDNNRSLHAQLKSTPAGVEELVQQAVSANNKKLQTAEDQLKQLQSQLEEVIVSDKIKEAAIKYGVAETAIQDILNRGKSTFTVKDGKPLPIAGQVDADGNVLSPEAWVKGLTTEAPHLFKQSVGGGALKSVPGGQAPSKNPLADYFKTLNK